MNSCRNALEILEGTSQTFYIPISRLPSGLQEAVASAYLCMRALDEVEDHSELDNEAKAKLLTAISCDLQAAKQDLAIDRFLAQSKSYQSVLAEVSLRIREWALLAPSSIAPRIWDATATMANRMACWAQQNWKIRTESDLDCYTFGVAATVGLLLCDLWAWYDGTKTNRVHAVGFGRGLQAVNILRNQDEDGMRDVDFFPDEWSEDRMRGYAFENLMLADAYVQALPPGPALNFCQIPLILAHGTLDASVKGDIKLSRNQVLVLIEQTTGALRF